MSQWLRDWVTESVTRSPIELFWTAKNRVVLFFNQLSDEKCDRPANRRSMCAISQNADIWYLTGLQLFHTPSTTLPVPQQSGKSVLKSWHRPISISFKFCVSPFFHFFALGFPPKGLVVPVSSACPTRAALVVGRFESIGNNSGSSFIESNPKPWCQNRNAPMKLPTNQVI